ncbi:MAG: metallophosphoesterase [Ignavibacteriales bacterium CG07_land_8_20_14_0_80_59_12]|nr:MAG: metallophosphoesterase [Ignavibacteriales bacterium CG07_land_8_20_14_0_80_59_12]
MRKFDFIMFFSIVLTLYLAINYYVFRRGWEAIPHGSSWRDVYLAVFLLLSFSFLAGRFLERASMTWFSHLLVFLGSFWLAALALFVIIILTIDFLRLVNAIVPFFPSFITADYVRTRTVMALAVTGVVFLTVLAGHINALHPRVRILDLTIHKHSNPLKTLNIVVASDIHLGTIIGRPRLERIVEKISALNPDIVLLPGDVFDEDIGPVIKQNLGDTLRKIKAKFGVLAVPGNHEYIGGVEEACRYLTEHGVTVLRDSIIGIDNSVTIIGREDLSYNRAARRPRKTLRELMAGVDTSRPVIVMDHQPFHLEEAAASGVDFQISGHTHHGQIWPFNFITRRVYELSWGYMRKGETQYYVSCGVGTWGPPVRTGNRPEIVNIRLQFD